MGDQSGQNFSALSGSRPQPQRSGRTELTTQRATGSRVLRQALESDSTSSASEPYTAAPSPAPFPPTGNSDDLWALQSQFRANSIGSSGPAQLDAYRGLLEFQPTYGPTRSLFVSQRQMSASQLKAEAASFGEVQCFEHLDDATFCVTFFDIRAAQACCEQLNLQLSAAQSNSTASVRGSSRQIEKSQTSQQPAWYWQPPPVFFVKPRTEEASRGSLLITGQDSFVSAVDARSICSEQGQTGFVWGPIPQAHTSMPAHLVHFHDVRAAQQAAQKLHGRMLRGNRILVERVADPVPSYAWPAVPSMPAFLPLSGVPALGLAPSSPAREHGDSPPPTDPRQSSSQGGRTGRTSPASAALPDLSPVAAMAARVPASRTRSGGQQQPFPPPMMPHIPGTSPSGHMMHSASAFGALPPGSSPFAGFLGGNSPPPGFMPEALPLHRVPSGSRTKYMNSDPSQFQYDPEEPERKGDAARKTLMIRNIPNKYTQSMLLELLDSHSRDLYDFFYLPVDFKNRCNLGYAFVNFPKASDTIRCHENFHGSHWKEFNSKKVCEVTYARIQGRAALVKHFKNSRFPNNDADCLPLVGQEREGEQGKRILVPLLELFASQSAAQLQDAAAAASSPSPSPSPAQPPLACESAAAAASP